MKTVLLMLLFTLITPSANTFAADSIDPPPSATPGKVIVNHDEWTLNNTGYSNGNAKRFVENMLKYNALFLASTQYIDNSILLDYVKFGGNVYICGGTGSSTTPMPTEAPTCTPTDILTATPVDTPTNTPTDIPPYTPAPPVVTLYPDILYTGKSTELWIIANKDGFPVAEGKAVVDGKEYVLDTNGQTKVIVTPLSAGELEVKIYNQSGSFLVSKKIKIYSVAKGYLDYPAEGTTISGIYNVAGWYYDPAGVAKVEVLLDDVLWGTAEYGFERPDVPKVFPWCGTKVGFRYKLDTTKLSEGNHGITIRIIGNDGQQTCLKKRIFNVPVQVAKGFIDYPKANTPISGVYNVSGWFYDSTGVSRVEVLVDGVVKGTATYGMTYDLSRQDESKVFQYPISNAGYSFKLDTTALCAGIHEIAVRGTGANGIQTTLKQITVTVPNQTVRGFVDYPKSNIEISGIYKVSGWFYNATGVDKVEVLVDGVVKGTAEHGLERPDVLCVYPDSSSDTGYCFKLNTSTLCVGTHNITVRGTGTNGIQTTLKQVTVTVPDQTTRGFIDSPKANAEISGIYNVSGWFYNATGVRRVQILVDGVVRGNADIDLYRPDVPKVYPECDNYTGYRFKLNTSKYDSGKHTIEVIGIGMNGIHTKLGNISVIIVK
jgi:hypothetical protein